MATSGTIGQTEVNVMKVIEQAARRAKTPPSILTADNIESAKTDLFLLLSDLANRGISLWCVSNQLVSLAAAQSAYPLPVGTVDVLNAFYRTQTYPAATAGGDATSLTAEFTAATRVDTLGLLASATGTATLAVETSPDGVAWAPAIVLAPFAAVAGQHYWIDLDPSATALFVRVRETLLPTIGFSAAEWANAPYEIAMSAMSRDTYTTLPNKEFGSGRPLQYWFDKQVTPRLLVWPVPLDGTGLLSLWVQRHIQDVGELTDTLDIPQRWQESIIATLAHKMSMVLDVPLEVVQYLEGQAEKHLRRAEDGEVDGAPIQLGPALRHYTRG